MKAYLSGPISFDKDFKDKFALAESKVASKGYHPINPVVIGETLKKHLGRDPSYEEYLREDFRALLDCQIIIMLPGWKNSTGAMREHDLALWSGLDVIELSEI
jgi:hypothetical protein